jgi:hypothetical protein
VSDIARTRAAAQRLSAPAAWTAGRLVAWLGAVQAQDYPIAKWSIAQRLATAVNADVEDAVAAGVILRTHVLRPTWHFVARDDLRWMQALTGPRVLALMGHYDRRNGVDGALVTRSRRIIAAAIARRGHLTRREIAAALTDARIRTTPWLVGQLLIHAELRAVVCSGAPRDGHQTYALVDERAPRASTLTRDEAIAELTRRYIQSHGPATAKDYQWWSGLSAADAKRGLDMVGRALACMHVDGRTYYAGAAGAARAAGRLAQIIQPFDEFVVAYSESRDAADESGAARAKAGGLLLRGVIADGQLIARWNVAGSRGSRTIALEPFRRLSSAERAAAKNAAARFARVYLAALGSH